MFELMPFGFEDNSLLKSFDNFEKHFMREMNRSMSGFRTDIEDKGDHYLLEAELPGFDLERQLLNVNRPEDLERARLFLKKPFTRAL